MKNQAPSWPREVVEFVSSDIINVLQGIQENLLPKLPLTSSGKRLSDRAIFSTWSFFALSEHWQGIKSPSVLHSNAFRFAHIEVERSRDLYHVEYSGLAWQFDGLNLAVSSSAIAPHNKMIFTTLVTKSLKGGLYQTSHILKRHAHKKASINVKLNTYIEGLGLKDEIVTVRPGLMRNVLLPSKQASYITKFNGPRDRNAIVSEPVAQKTVDPSIGIKRQDTAARKLFADLSSLPGSLEFVRAVIPDTTTTFGSVTSEDIVEKLKEYDITLDKRLVLNEKVKSLGRHEISIKCGESQVNIDVMVKAA